MFLIAVETEFVTTENVNVLQDSEYKKIVVAKIQVYKPLSKNMLKITNIVIFHMFHVSY